MQLRLKIYTWFDQKKYKIKAVATPKAFISRRIQTIKQITQFKNNEYLIYNG